LFPNFLFLLSISGFKFFFDASIYGSDALFNDSTKPGSSAYQIGHLNKSSLTNCFGYLREFIFCFLFFFFFIFLL